MTNQPNPDELRGLIIDIGGYEDDPKGILTPRLTPRQVTVYEKMVLALFSKQPQNVRTSENQTFEHSKRPATTGGEVREQLAAIEHERWADWQQWIHDSAKKDWDKEGSPIYSLTVSQIHNWQEQIDTLYADLSEREKQSDRDQVARYWPLIEQYVGQALTKQLQELRERLPEPISDWKGGLLWKSQDATAGMIYGHHLALLEVIKLIEEMEK